MEVFRIDLNASSNSPLLPELTAKVSCGFPSPANDHLEPLLDLFAYLVESPNTTYFAVAEGESMRDRIQPGDLLIIDRSPKPKNGDVIIACVNGELACKILDLENRCLRSANPKFAPIPISNELEVICEGVVIHAITHVRRQ